MRRIVLIALCSFLGSLPGAAQTASIVHLGYSAPRPVVVAPGQVLHLELHGLSTVFNSTQVAQSLPLPTFFNGLSVSLQRSGSAAPETLPLLRLETDSSCFVALVASLLGPTNTVPWFDLAANSPGADSTVCATATCVVNPVNDAVLTVVEASGAGLNLRILPVVDQIHILNSCTDNILGLLGLEGSSVYASYACVPAITHSNNSWVTGANPARPGEELVAYAYGMGAPPPPYFDATLGTPAAGVQLNKPFSISFAGLAQAATKPDYVGLVGGNPGLYQINFHMPALPATLALCNPPPALNQLSTVPTNFTMTLVGTASMDQASFCVQP
jgi:hypothetical protein